MFRPLSAANAANAVNVPSAVLAQTTPLSLFFRTVDQWRVRYEQGLQAEALAALDDATLADIGYARDAFGLRHTSVR
ncbi:MULTISPECIES: DUF1127 domain-containing protein [unclassified Pandoraea]|uniref:DUF1127 domain-containing protein n=1 Tax=unclassified Pandoraea TaxID=2624094 RepID=UPI001481FD4E|nr:MULTISPECIES: DUF1127 domain-containing protein [unclassified Pandoraea]